MDSLDKVCIDSSNRFVLPSRFTICPVKNSSFVPGLGCIHAIRDAAKCLPHVYTNSHAYSIMSVKAACFEEPNNCASGDSLEVHS